MVEHAELGRHGIEQPGDLVRAALVGEGRPVGQNSPHGVGHAGSGVPDVAVVLHVADHEGQRPQLRGRRQGSESAGDRGGRVPAAGHDFQQQPLRRQDGLDRLAPEVGGALEVLRRELEALLVPALVGGLEETDGLQVQESVVVGSAQPGLGQRGLGPAVGVLRIVEGGQLQPGGRIVGKPVRHVLQDALEPPLHGAVSPQQIEDEEVAVAIVGIGLETRRHEVDEDHGGVARPSAEQPVQGRLHVGGQQFRMDGLAAGARRRLQHARPGEGPVFRAGKLRRQRIEEGGGRRRMPQAGLCLLPPEEDSGQDPGRPIAGGQPPRQRLERAAGDEVANRRQPRDLQQIDPGETGVVGVEDVGQTLNRRPGRAHVPFVDGSLQLAGEGRRPPPLTRHAPRRPGATVVAAAAVRRNEAPPFGDGAGQGEVGRQAIEGPAQPVVVVRAETDRGLAEKTPGRERRAPGHPLQKGGGPPPLAGVHGADTGHDLPGIPTQRMTRVEDVESLPAALDDEPIRQRPFHPEHGRRGGHVVRVGRHRVSAIQMPDVPDPVVFRQRLRRNGGPVAIRPGAHRGRFPVHALRGKLPGALHAGAERHQRQPRQAVVPILHLPDQVERVAPVSPGERLPRLIQQTAGGYARRARRCRPLPIAAIASGGHPGTIEPRELEPRRRRRPAGKPGSTRAGRS